MERVPVPEDSGSDLTLTLRLLERAHIEGQLDAHDHYAIPLITVTKTDEQSVAKSLLALDILVNRLLRNFNIEPEEWATHLKPDAAFMREKASTEGVSAAAYLYHETADNIFHRSSDRSYGGAALLFTVGDSATVELRGTSQFQRARVYENPHTTGLLNEPDDQDLIDLLRQEHDTLVVMGERMDAELDFVVYFDRA